MSTTLNFTCPGCNRALRMPQTLLGRMVRCPACRASFTTPSPVKEGSKSRSASPYLLLVCLGLTALTIPLMFATPIAFLCYGATLHHEERMHGYVDPDLHNPSLRYTTLERNEGEDRLAHQMKANGLDSGYLACIAMMLALVLFTVSTTNCGLSAYRLWKGKSWVAVGTLVVGIVGVLWAFPGFCCCISRLG